MAPSKPPTPSTAPTPPSTLTDPRDIDFFQKFSAIDSTIPNPPDMTSFLFYSGGTAIGQFLSNIRTYINTMYGENPVPWPTIYPLHVIPKFKVKKGPQGALQKFFDKNLSNTTVPNLELKCLSIGLARRAAKRGGVVHLLLYKGAPLVRKYSHWGAYEAGIVTAAESKVTRIVRWDVELEPSETVKGQREVVMYPGDVVWIKGRDAPLGTPWGEQDWTVDTAERSGDMEGAIWKAERLPEGEAPDMEGLCEGLMKMGIMP